VEQKATADYIVTSRNVEAIARAIHKKKEKFLFSPDRNMGNWLSRTLGVEIPSWSAVCEVHDQFDRKRLEERFESCEYRPVLIAHPESPMNILERADYVGSTAGMLEWIDTFGQPSAFRGTSWTPQEIFVATEFELIRMMRERRPDLKIWQVPVIADCRCNECPYMKLNSAAKVKAAIAGEGGTVIDYLDPEVMEKARVPVERMMYFNKYGHLPDGPGS
jgi:quinolinate synthase